MFYYGDTVRYRGRLFSVIRFDGTRIWLMDDESEVLDTTNINELEAV